MPHACPKAIPKMPTEKLTDHRVKYATAPTGTRIELWDAVLPGLGLRVSSTSIGTAGSKTWFVRYRFGAKQRRMKIGNYPVLGLAEARASARHLLSESGRGIDPAAARRRPLTHAAGQTFAQVAESFVLRYAKQHNRSWRETERILNRYVLPEWGKRPIQEIGRRDVVGLLDGMIDRGAPVMAKQTHATIRKLFYWAVDRDIIDASPCARVPVPAHAVDRDRVLTDDELSAVWLACDPLKWPFGPLVRLLILTGQRRDEVATLAWHDIDEKKGLWTIPRERNKSNRTHEVPLSSAVRAVLEVLPRVDRILVFTTNGKVPVAGFSNAKRRLDDLSQVRDWRLHDLRRTAASGMARIGVAPHVVEKILNHKGGAISGVAAIYNRHAYLEEKRTALQQWADHIDRVIAARAV